MDFWNAKVNLTHVNQGPYRGLDFYPNQVSSNKKYMVNKETRNNNSELPLGYTTMSKGLMKMVYLDSKK